MKKLFNFILSLAAIGYFVLYIWSLIKGAAPLGDIGAFIINYGAIILTALFAFNNLLAKITSVFFIILILVVIILIILFVNPSLITGLFAK